MRTHELALTYLEGFCTNNRAVLEQILADEFTLNGPLFDFDSKSAYLNALAEDADPDNDFEIIEIVEGPDTLSIYYIYKKPTGNVLVSQLFWFRDSKIARTLLVFDSASVA